MRRAPLRRKTLLQKRRGQVRRSERVRDLDYMLDWVKRQPCAAWGLSRCGGEIEADHAGKRGMGQKCSDHETIPLCTLHHRQRTDFSGPFRGWTRELMRAWLDQWIRRTQNGYAEFVSAVDRVSADGGGSPTVETIAIVGTVNGPFPVGDQRETSFRQEG